MAHNPYSGRIVRFPLPPRRARRRRTREEREARLREARAHARIRTKGGEGDFGVSWRGILAAVLFLALLALCAAILPGV